MCRRGYFILIFIIFLAKCFTGDVKGNPNEPEIYRRTGEILQDLIPKVEVINFKLAKIEAKLNKMENNYHSQLIEAISKLIDVKLESIDNKISKSQTEAENNLHNYLNNRLQAFEEKITGISMKSLEEMDSKLNSTVDDIKTEHEKCKNSYKRQIDNNFENQKNISMILEKRLENIQNNSDSRLQAIENKVTVISNKMDSKLNTTTDDIMKSMKTEHKNVENAIKQRIDESFESQKNILMSIQKPVEQIHNDTKELEPKIIEIPSHPDNCAEILKNKQSPDGIYKLYTPGVSPFDAYCMRDSENVDSPAWTVIQRRRNGRVSFTRTWTEYKNGFGDWENNFWLGLDRMHALTSQQNYELLIDLENEGHRKYYAKYDYFAISNEEDGYRLKLGKFSGDARDSFSHNNNMKFSTLDVDNDSHSSLNCAEYYKGGWWYTDCGAPKLNGEYNTDKYKKSIYWSYSLDLYNLKYAQMAIRPKDIN